MISSFIESNLSFSFDLGLVFPVMQVYIQICESLENMQDDENNSAKVGETVRIQECKPISKLKSWEIIADAS